HWDAHRLREVPTATAPAALEPDGTARTWSTVAYSPPAGIGRHLLFVESNTTGTGMLALDRARELGTVPVLLTGDPDRYRGLAETGAEVVRCDTNSDAALRAAVQERFRREEIAGVTTTSDFYVPAAARIAQWLGLPGNPPDAVAVCRDKAALRERLRAEGVRQPRYALVREPAGAAEAVARTGLPCVVKPADDSGSTNVLLCADESEVRAQIEKILAIDTNVRGMPTARTVLVEEYLDGPEYSVEMFGGDGQAVCVGITAKSVTEGPHFVEHRHLFPAPLPAATAQQITETVTAALDATGIRLGATHTEVKLTADGPTLIEINPRPAGGMIPELIRLATGVDLLGEQLRVALGVPPHLKAEGAGHAGIQFVLADADGTLTAAHGTREAAAVEGVESVLVTAAPGTPVRKPRSASD
ncbi:ATP-grasp domain-containing protein, partial [Streptomyces sp. NPDC059835]|uniref:ATP-grasp domain-containing protein n=1 Tax=Streptomyces sp. NPDC059835 TaxID=3346967 RepID=UPI003650B0AF